MASPAAEYTDEFRRETADCAISTGRPISECCRESDLDSKTVNQWAIKRRRELFGQPDPRVEDREPRDVFRQEDLSKRDCSGNPGPKPSYAARPKSLRYCMGLL